MDQQVVAFRVLPRDLAADVFEYLPLEAQERLLRAMAREDVARILNEMAPDDRTALLDELPGTVTQHLLNLLTPEERAVAVTLARLSGRQRRTAHDPGLRPGRDRTGPSSKSSTTSAGTGTTARPSRSSTSSTSEGA